MVKYSSSIIIILLAIECVFGIFIDFNNWGIILFTDFFILPEASFKQLSLVNIGRLNLILFCFSIIAIIVIIFIIGNLCLGLSLNGGYNMWLADKM